MLSVVFQDKKISEEFYKIYYEMLNDVPDEIIVNAVKDCLRVCKFFPTIAEIRDKTKQYLDKIKLSNSEPVVDECIKTIETYVNGQMGCEIRESCHNSYNGKCLVEKAIKEIKDRRLT